MVSVFTYAHAKWFYGQSERVYYLNYFINLFVNMVKKINFQLEETCNSIILRRGQGFRIN